MKGSSIIKSISAVAAMAIGSYGMAQPNKAYADHICAENSSDLVELVQKRFNHFESERGKGDDGRVYVVATSGDETIFPMNNDKEQRTVKDETWTVFYIEPNGKNCILVGGQDWIRNTSNEPLEEPEGDEVGNVTCPRYHKPRYKMLDELRTEKGQYPISRGEAFDKDGSMLDVLASFRDEEGKLTYDGAMWTILKTINYGGKLCTRSSKLITGKSWDPNSGLGGITL